MHSRLILILAIVGFAQASIYAKYYDEAFKITQAMSIDQKIGQTVQVDFNALIDKNGTDQAQALKYFLGSVLVGGDGVPDANGNMVIFPTQEDKIKELYLNGTMTNWQALANKFNGIGPQITTADGKTFRIKLLLGTDAVHNNQHVVGTILFPHNTGLACSHNPNNFYNQGYWTGVNVKTSGFNYAFAPTVAVSHNPQWGRFYETMGQEDSYISQYAKEFVRGLQNIDSKGNWNGVVGSVKHFLGDGATIYGADEGNAHVHSFKTFVDHNIQGYKGAIASEVGTVMASYSGINGIPNAISPFIQNLLKDDLKFDGFVISDYDEMNRIPNQQMPTSFVNMTDDLACSAMFNAGIDMFMLPGYLGPRAITQYFNNVKTSLKNNTMTLSRLDDAVTRILAVKMAMGLVEQIKADRVKVEKPMTISPPPKVTTEYADSLQAVRESLVLLKNDNNLLPLRALRSSIEYVVLVGQRIINVNHLSKNELFRNFDDIGMQCGGWTIRWQGFEGNYFWSGENKAKTNASSVLSALGSVGGKFNMVYPNYTTMTQELKIDTERFQYLESLKTLRKNMTAKNTVIIGVIGESPYAETAGDVGIPYCKGGIFASDGCRYDGSNPYLPETQSATLSLDYEKFDINVIDHIREADKTIPLITVVVSGRPMLINNPLNISTAVIAAWLPGTSGGQGIVDAITGDYILKPKQTDRVNTLAFDWPKDEASTANYPVYESSGQIPKMPSTLFQVGYGLSTAGNSEIEA